MLPREIVCEIMSHITDCHDIKHMAMVNKLFRSASQHTAIQKMVRLGKMRQTRLMGAFLYNRFILNENYGAHVYKIFQLIPVSESEIQKDLNFVNYVSEKDYLLFRPDFMTVKDVPTFDTTLCQAAKCSCERKVILDTFVKHCTTIYETALDYNDVLTQIALLMLFDMVIRSIYH